MTSLKPTDIFDNIAFSSMKSNIITLHYYHNDFNTVDKVVNTLMKESIKADILLTKDIAERDNKLVKELSIKIDKEADLLPKQEVNIDMKIINYYKYNVDSYQQLIKKNEENQKRFKQYLKQKKEVDEMNGVNIKIVEWANSSCSMLGYFR